MVFWVNFMSSEESDDGDEEMIEVCHSLGAPMGSQHFSTHLMRKHMWGSLLRPDAKLNKNVLAVPRLACSLLMMTMVKFFHPDYLGCVTVCNTLA